MVSILYLGPDPYVNNILVDPEPFDATKEYFVCVTVAVADSKMAQTYATIRIKATIIDLSSSTECISDLSSAAFCISS